MNLRTIVDPRYSRPIRGVGMPIPEDIRAAMRNARRGNQPQQAEDWLRWIDFEVRDWQAGRRPEPDWNMYRAWLDQITD